MTDRTPAERVADFLDYWHSAPPMVRASAVVVLFGEGENGIVHRYNLRADDLRALLSAAPAPAAVWWLKSDDDFGYDDPEVHVAEDAAKTDAIRVYREANDLTDDYLGWLGKELPDFAWREHREGGIELYVDAEATGLIVRQLTVKGAAEPVTA